MEHVASLKIGIMILLVSACATLKGQTVTATVGPSGACIESSGYVPVGHTGIECSGACAGTSGVEVTCRPVQGATP